MAQGPMAQGPGIARVLIVDDRADNLLALRAVLEPLGLDLVEADSGEEALRHLLAGEFALIILDVQMPVLDGFETARLIRGRERTRYVPIIFLTAISGEPEHHLRGYQSGAVDYVYKPFEPEILRAKVSVFVELWARGATIEAQRRELTVRLADLDEAHAGLAAQAVELERSNAALERFAEVVGVEVREPLHTVAGLLDLLDDRHAGALSDEGRTLLARALAGTDRARSIVGSLLDYARASTVELHRDRLPLVEVLAEAEAETGPQLAEAKAEIVADGLPLVWGDRGQLVHLLNQLLDNAVRFRGSAVPVVTVSAEAVGAAVRVTVADNGPGVAETDLPRLFTAFARPTPEGAAGGRGAGLGLALCRRIVERHGGMIWAERGADGGLVVRFELPEG
ncbi:MAG TPA: ATP-binding protein [Acidimicrobiia bacterium]|nr:ATP-binding protein [Acidimicrobiia bacterium]